MMKRLIALLVASLLLVGCYDKNSYEEPVAPVQTLLMYFPWSGNSSSQGLFSYFETNISDMEEVIRYGMPEGCRVLVYLVERVDQPSASDSQQKALQGTLFELKGGGGRVERVVHKTYAEPDMTTASAITALWQDVKAIAPAPHYAMTIGCHGKGWLPSVSTKTRDGVKHQEYWENEGESMTRWFGGMEAAYQTEIPTLAQAIADAGIKLDYILFDDCYMSSVEVAYELRNVADYLIGSTSEIMAEGFPYTEIGLLLMPDTRDVVSELSYTIDYAGICESFYQYYMERPSYPCGTVAVTVTRELEALAEVMKCINQESSPMGAEERKKIQMLDGYEPCLFYDLGHYVSFYCKNVALLSEFNAQLGRVVPAAYRRHTPTFFSNIDGGRYGENEIKFFSGITTSDPSINEEAIAAREQTAWWQATH